MSVTVFVFLPSALAELGSHYANRTFYVFHVLRNTLGPRVKFVDSYKYFTPPPHPAVVYATDRSKAVAPMLFLFCVGLWFIRFMF